MSVVIGYNLNDYFNSLTAIIGSTATIRASFGQGTGNIWLDNVNCAGTEARLGDCPANPVGSHNCNHFEDAGARCLPLGTVSPSMAVINNYFWKPLAITKITFIVHWYRNFVPAKLITVVKNVYFGGTQVM